MSDVEFILGGCAAVLVFWAVTALSIYRATRWSKRMHRELELHAPLLSTEHRLDAALREVEEGYNVCDVCGFENFKRFHFCNVCGEELADDELAKGVKHQAAERVRGFKKLWKSTKHGSVEILSRSSEPPRLTRSQRSRRQRRARQRKEWTRQLNADGKVVWVRDASDKAELRFPGTVVQFISPTTLAADGPDGAEDAEAIEVVVVDEPVDGVEAASGTGGPEEHQQQQRPREDRQSQSLEGNNSHSHSHSSNDGEEEEEAETPTTTASTRDPLLTRDERMRDLNAVVAAVSMELVEASLADAAVLPVVAASDAGLQWRDTVSLAKLVFPSKYAHFVTMTASVVVPVGREMIRLNVTREHLFHDSLESLSVIPVKSVRSAMRINFVDEAGVDAGGLHREWFVLLNEELAAPERGVFVCVGREDQMFYLNPNSRHDAGENHLMYYFAAGRLVGRALLDGYVLGFHLALPLIKTILGLPVSFADLEFFDPEAYRSLLWLVENTGVESLGLDFSVTEKRGDAIVTVDLILNGRNVDVTDANKLEYLERRFRYLLFESVSSQLFVFLKGLYEVIPQELLMIFDPEEFDYLLCGSDEIDVDDWEKHTKYTENLYEHRAMVWFWEIVREMPNEYRRRLLHFATGSSRVPIAGFSGLTSYDGRLCPFTLKGVDLVKDGYIWSHACFNRLDLPLHHDREQLKAVIFAALDTEMYGFTTA